MFSQFFFSFSSFPFFFFFKVCLVYVHSGIRQYREFNSDGCRALAAGGSTDASFIHKVRNVRFSFPLFHKSEISRRRNVSWRNIEKDIDFVHRTVQRNFPLVAIFRKEITKQMDRFQTLFRSCSIIISRRLCAIKIIDPENY